MAKGLGNIIYLVTLLVLVSSAVYAADIENIVLPRIKPMPGMKTEWAAEKMIYNGTPMSVQNFRTNRTEDEVIQFYTSAWKSNLLAEVSKNRVGDEWVIGYGKDDYYYSVQVKNASGGSEGSLVVTSSREINEKISLPMLPGGRMISRIQSLDLGVHAETLTIGSRQSISSALNWYDAELKRAGWIKQDVDSQGNQKVLISEYQRNKEQCQVRSISAGVKDEFTSILQITWIKG